MSDRKTRLVDCNPRWRTYDGKDDHASDALHFDCPEGHEGCSHIIPFSPGLDGAVVPAPAWNRGVNWQRTGDTFETLSLSPSIRRIPRHASREAAIAAGCIPEYVTDSLLCAFHGFITNGAITFCGDSK